MKLKKKRFVCRMDQKNYFTRQKTNKLDRLQRVSLIARKMIFYYETKVIQHKIDKWGILSTLLYELVVRIKPYNNRPWNFISILFSVQGGYQILDGGHDITSQNKCWPKPQKDKYLKKKLVSSKINWFLLHILP